MSAAPDHKAMRWLRRVALGIGLLAIVAAGLVGGAYVWLRTPPGLDWVRAQISNRFDSDTMDIEITGLSGDPFADLTVRGLTLADAGGVWLTAPELHLEWSPLALVTDSRLDIAVLDGDPVTIARLPEGKAEESASGPLLPALPFAVSLARLDLEVRFEEEAYQLAAEDVRLDPETLAGRLNLSGAIDHLALDFSNGPDGALVIAGNLIANPEGLIARLSGLKLDRPQEATLAATIADFDDGAGSLTFHMAGGDIGLDIDGPFDLQGKPLLDAADIKVSLPGLEREAFSVADPALTGKLTLSRTRLDLAWQLKASRVTMPDVSLANTALEGTLGFEAGQAEGAIRAQDQHLDLQGKALTIQSLDAAWRADTASKAWSVAVSELASNWLTATAFNAQGTGGEVASANGTIELLPAFLNDVSEGQISAGSLQLAVAAEPAGSGFAFTIMGEGRGLKAANEKLGALLGETPALSLKAGYAEDRLTITDAEVTGALVTATAAGSYDTAARDVDVTADLHLADLAPLTGDAVALSDGLTVTLEAAGPVDTLTLQARSHLAAFEGYGLALTNVQAAVDMEKGSTGKLTLTADTKLGPSTLASPFSLKDGFALTDIRLTTPVFTGKGKLAQREVNGLTANMRLDLAAENKGVQGDAHIEAAFANNQLTGTLAANQLRVAVPGKFPIRLRTANGTFAVNLQGETPHYTADIASEGFIQGAQRVNRIVLKADSAAEVPITLNAAGNWIREFSLDLGVNPAPDAITATLQARYGDIPLRTRAPIRLERGDVWKLSAPDVMLAGGKVSLEATGGNAIPTITASIAKLDMAALNLITPGLVATGLLSGELDLHPKDGTLAGTTSLSLAGVSFLGGSSLEAPAAYDMQLDGTAEDGLLSLTGRILSGGAEQGRINAKLPYLKDRPTLTLDSGAPLEANLDWQGDITPLWALARRPEHQLSGTLEGKLALTGTADDPVFNGHVSLQDGRYEYEKIGLVAQIKALEVAGNRGEVRLTRFEATDGEKGTMTGSGAFTLTHDFDFPGSLELHLAGFHAARLESLDATASADLVYARENRQGKLSGTVKTGPIKVKMPRELPPSVVEIEVKELNRDEGPDAASPTEALQAPPTLFDLRLEIADRFQFSGRGLESEWAGALHITGNSDDPRITGQMRLKNGTFTFASKRFTLADGRLTFSGRKGIDPDLSIRAELPTPGLTAGMLISGRASAPNFTLTSSPALPEDEILARMLFGRSVSDVSALQLAELAVAAEGLRSGRSSSLTGGIGRRLGLDSLAVISGGENGDETLITGGKYLTDNIYLEVETAPTRNETTTRLKISLTDRLLLESEAGAAPGSRLRLKWFWEY